MVAEQPVPVPRWHRAFSASTTVMLPSSCHRLVNHGNGTEYVLNHASGHATDPLVLNGHVRDARADFGRHGQVDAVDGPRRLLVLALRTWTPLVAHLHQYFIAVSRSVVKHQGRGGIAVDLVVRGTLQQHMFRCMMGLGERSQSGGEFRWLGTSVQVKGISELNKNRTLPWTKRGKTCLTPSSSTQGSMTEIYLSSAHRKPCPIHVLSTNFCLITENSCRPKHMWLWFQSVSMLVPRVRFAFPGSLFTFLWSTRILVGLERSFRTRVSCVPNPVEGN